MKKAIGTVIVFAGIATSLTACGSSDLRDAMVNECYQLATDAVTSSYVDLNLSYITQSKADPNQYLVTLVAKQPSKNFDFGSCVGVDEHNGNGGMRAATNADLLAYNSPDAVQPTPTPSPLDFSGNETTYVITGSSHDVTVALTGLDSTGQAVSKQVSVTHLPWHMTVNGDSPYALGGLTAKTHDGRRITCKVLYDGDVTDSEKSDPSTGVAICTGG